jgi:hypothetical protein
MEFRDGGYWHYAMITPDGDEYWNRLDYQSASPIRLHRQGWLLRCVWHGQSGYATDWTVSFAEAASGKALVTTQVVYASTEVDRHGSRRRHGLHYGTHG